MCITIGLGQTCSIAFPLTKTWQKWCQYDYASLLITKDKNIMWYNSALVYLVQFGDDVK